ncbi:uncharacterized protein LOC109543453 [Dendroctonus ponderosae]|uniref:Syntaxin N-terminal domain-containing protein n=1 Tax=Dendroctonus ponderosae TaxID=77166 RepID=A0AAR5Q688_DENPD|nr:uncharacterized protein LOC109543453 [Dendroctonus ponderosae]
MEASIHLKDENNGKTKSACSEEIRALPGVESQCNFSKATEEVLKANVSKEALENIKQIFDKTRSIRKVADGKHQEIQAQFKDLRERLNSSSECLNRMKKGIDNIKFSYQAKVGEVYRTLSPSTDYVETPRTKEELAEKVEDIRNKIEEIQKRVSIDKDKHSRVIQSYQEAFDHVSTMLENIEQGNYSSMKLKED